MLPIVTDKDMAPAPDHCPAHIEEVAEAYALDSLNGADLADFEEHLLVCVKPDLMCPSDRSHTLSGLGRG